MSRKELSFLFTSFASMFLSYLLIIQINRESIAIKYYLALATGSAISSITSLGITKSILRYYSPIAFINAIIITTIAGSVSGIVLTQLYGSEFFFLGFAIIIDLIHNYYRKNSRSLNFVFSKIFLTVITLTMLKVGALKLVHAVYFGYLAVFLIFLLDIRVMFKNKLKVNDINLRKQLKYSLPLALNDTLTILASYIDQIFLFAKLQENSLNEYTLLIRLGIGIRSLYLVPHVRLLPLISDAKNHNEDFLKFWKYYLMYIAIISSLLVAFANKILSIFSINGETYGELFIFLILAEIIRSLSGYIRILNSIREKTIFNLISNTLHFSLVILFFHPLFTILSIKGLIYLQIIASAIQLIYDLYATKTFNKNLLLRIPFKIF